jgi:hypothetical protein
LPDRGGGMGSNARQWPRKAGERGIRA